MYHKKKSMEKDKVELTETDLEQLWDLTNKVDKWLKKNSNLAENLEIKKKTLGFLGEAYAYIEVYKTFKDEIKWPGMNKAGHDIELKGNKIQVKTSSQNKFSVINIENAEKYIPSIKNEYLSGEGFTIPKSFKEEIDHQVNDIDADYWILVGWSKSEQELSFFILNKKDMKKMIKKDYERYIKERKHKHKSLNGYRFGVSKSSVLRIMIEYRLFKKDFERFRNRWDKIKIETNDFAIGRQ